MVPEVQISLLAGKKRKMSGRLSRQPRQSRPKIKRLPKFSLKREQGIQTGRTGNCKISIREKLST
jgi:hypothetical protein